MNLYLFNDNNIASAFGIGTYIKELVSALTLNSSNIHIHIVHLHAARPKFEIETINQIENWYLPEVCNDEISFSSIRNIEVYCRNVLYLLRLYISENKKNLIFHFNYNHYQLLAKELKAFFDCKIVTTIHFVKWMLDLQGNHSLFQTIKTKHENQLSTFEKSIITTDEYESLLYQEVDKVIALSWEMKSFLCSEYLLEPDKISVVPNGLNDTNCSGFRSQVSGLSVNTVINLQKKWHISENESVIIFVGRLHTVKGVKYLIRAFRKVLEQMPDCRLMIAGSGNFDIYMTEAKDICTKITFTGLLEKQALYELYQMANIGVMPSFHEQCSYVAIEMMMHGVPLIASTSTGLKEMVEDGVTGLHIPVIEYNDSAEIDTDLLAEKMLFLLQNPDERQRMGANARKRYMEKYSSTAFGANMIAFYESLFRDNKHKSSL